MPQELLRRVYKRIYKKDNVEFILLPMPRLEVESVEDMKILFEIGALTPDMSLQLSHIMIGEDLENKKQRMQLEREGAAVQRRQQQKLSSAQPGPDQQGSMDKEQVEAIKGGGGADKKDRSDPKKHPPPLGKK